MALRKEDALYREKILYPSGNYSYQFIFNCLDCGGRVSSQQGYLPQHSGKCVSCSHKKLPYGAAFRNLTDNRHARKVPVTLTYDEFYELCQFLDCHYCLKPLNRTKNRSEPHYRSYLLDRKDNNLGYSFDNCVPCCWKCNQTKGNRFTYEEFLAISKGLREYREYQDKPHWREEFMWTDDEWVLDYA